jgi:hypothetical protein
MRVTKRFIEIALHNREQIPMEEIATPGRVAAAA